MSSSKLAVFLFVVIATPAICEKCGVENLPEFRDTAHPQRDGLQSGTIALIPSYNFTCAGYISQWRAHVERRRNRYDRYEMSFSVWRRTEKCAVTKVGENYHAGLAPEVDENGTVLGTVTLNVHDRNRILVQPGDFVGFWVRHYEVDWPSGQETGPGSASVMVDLNRTDVLVWTRPLPFDLNCIESWEVLESVFEPHPLAAAPVIDVSMEMRVRTEIPPTTSATATVTVASTPTVATVASVTDPSTSATSPSVSRTVESPTVSHNEKIITLTRIIIGAGVIAVLFIGLFLLPLVLCVLAVKRNCSSKEHEYEDMHMMMNRVYSCKPNHTIPGHYRTDSDPVDKDGPHYCSVYNTLTPKPVPQPNPTPVGSSAMTSPAFLPHSESVSSNADDYEVLYSVVSPFHQQSSNNSIDCPLYSETSTAHQDPTSDYTYDVPNVNAPSYTEEEGAKSEVVYDVPNDMMTEEVECEIDGDTP